MLADTLELQWGFVEKRRGGKRPTVQFVFRTFSWAILGSLAIFDILL